MSERSAEYERPILDAAARILDAWGAAGLIDGRDSRWVGDPDPEWLKAKLAAKVMRQLGGTADA